MSCSVATAARATSAWTGSRPMGSARGATGGSPSSAATASSRSARTWTSAGAKAANHLFLVDQKETRYVDCTDVPLLYGERLVDDVVNRTETAMPQAHAFLAMELALLAEKHARKLT